jgi:hypothetical protein
MFVHLPPELVWEVGEFLRPHDQLRLACVGQNCCLVGYTTRRHLAETKAVLVDIRFDRREVLTMYAYLRHVRRHNRIRFFCSPKRDWHFRHNRLRLKIGVYLQALQLPRTCIHLPRLVEFMCRIRRPLRFPVGTFDDIVDNVAITKHAGGWDVCVVHHYTPGSRSTPRYEDRVCVIDAKGCVYACPMMTPTKARLLQLLDNDPRVLVSNTSGKRRMRCLLCLRSIYMNEIVGEHCRRRIRRCAIDVITRNQHVHTAASQ